METIADLNNFLWNEIILITCASNKHQNFSPRRAVYWGCCPSDHCFKTSLTNPQSLYIAPEEMNVILYLNHQIATCSISFRRPVGFTP